MLLGGNKELDSYIRTGGGLGRVGLNVMCFIGFFIFGWLLAMVFQMMGKKNMGWLYIVPLLICLAIARFAVPWVGLVGIGIYVIGWIHANLVLSDLQSKARARLREIKLFSADQLTTDSYLEKGLLKANVLANTPGGAASFAKAWQIPGGDPQLLRLAGLALFGGKRYAQAKLFFERVLAGTTDPVLIKQLNLSLVNVQKKIDKSLQTN